ncbi:protein GVQW3-like [Rhynchophorus ferrugineus]
MGKNTAQAKVWLRKHYGDSAPGKSTIVDWYAQFRRGRMNTDDAHRSGRPVGVVTPENIEKIHKMVLNNRKLKLQEIADNLKISKERVSHILHESLGMRRLCSKWEYTLEGHYIDE